jgi:hypothetical protein
MALNLHIFDPELDKSWIRDQDNVLEGIVRLGIWQAEVESYIQFGWGFGTLDTYKTRLKPSEDFLSISNYDMKYGSFDGTVTKQGLSDRYESSFYDELTLGSKPNARISGSYVMQPYMDVVNSAILADPVGSAKLHSPYRWWTVYRTRGTFTVKYAFGGTLPYGWWIPDGLVPNYLTYPYSQPTALNVGQISSIDWNWPPAIDYHMICIEKSEFSNKWFSYKSSFDWPSTLDSGVPLDQSASIWKKFYHVGTGYQQFATIDVLNQYAVSYRIEDNIEFDGDQVVELTNRLDTRHLFKQVELDSVSGIESQFTLTTITTNGTDYSMRDYLTLGDWTSETSDVQEIIPVVGSMNFFNLQPTSWGS